MRFPRRIDDLKFKDKSDIMLPAVSSVLHGCKNENQLVVVQ